MSKNEPFRNSNINEAKFYLDKISKTDNDKLMFRILNTGILLEPYFQTGSTFSGPRTYFSLGK